MKILLVLVVSVFASLSARADTETCEDHSHLWSCTIPFADLQKCNKGGYGGDYSVVAYLKAEALKEMFDGFGSDTACKKLILNNSVACTQLQ